MKKNTRIVFGGSRKLPPQLFSIEVKGLSTGNWCPQTTCESDDEATVRATMRAQGSEWMLDKREWRVVPNTPHVYGAGTRLSSLYTMGRDGLPFPAHGGDKSSAGYKAWKAGHDSR